MTTDILLYHGRPMARHPVGSRIERVASDLKNGHAVGVELNPGDGTSYRLLLAPAWDKQYRDATAGVGKTGKGYLLVSYYTGMYAFALPTAWPTLADKLNIRNEWTARLLAWWLAELWAEIEEA